MRVSSLLLAALAAALTAAGGASARSHAAAAHTDVGAYAAAVLADAPLAYWRLDDSACCTAEDASGNGNIGNYWGTIQYGQPGITGDGGTSVAFGSEDARVARAPITQKLRDVTLEAWVYRTGAGKPLVVYNGDSGHNGYGLLISDGACFHDGDKLTILVGGNSCDATGSNATVPLNAWTYVALTRTSDGTWTLYVNGHANSTGTVEANPIDQYLGETSAGASWLGRNNHLDGRVDEVAIYDHPLPADRILAHYEAAVGTDGGGGGECTGDRCPQGVTPFRPLIVVPGTLGTYIENSSDLLWVKAFRLWSQDADSALDPLQLDPDGVDPMFPYDTATVALDKGYEGMIRKLVPCDVPIPKFCETQHHYDITMGALQDAGYVYHNHEDETHDQTLFAFGYDWRRSSQDNAVALRTKIKHVLALTGAKQVDILAHSQGGLVANAYLHIWGSEGDVRRVVTLGTPYLGTPKFLGILQFKEPCEIAVGDNCILNRNEAAKLVHNFPGSIQLLPSERYWQVAASPLVERVQPLSGPSTREVQTYDGMVSRLQAGKQNMLLVRAAGTLHGFWDHWPATPGVDVLRIAGTKEATIGTIEEYRWNGCIVTPDGYSTIWDCGWHTEIKNHYTSGDGTVVSQSAQLRNCRTGVNLAPGEPSLQRPHVSHEGLVHDAATMNAALAFLRHGTLSGPACPATVLRRRLAAADDDGLDATELRTTGPLVGSITDGTDVTGTIDAAQDVAVVNIPDSSFDPADGSASYVVTSDAQLQGTFTATADGPVSLEVHRYADDNLVETAVLPRTDVKAGAVVSLSYARPQDLSLLRATIDDDGDGSVDRTIAFMPPVSGDAAEDDSPPTSTVTVTHLVGSDGTKLARVVVDATDEGGSGVGEIRYQTSRGASGLYSEPLVLPAQGDISVTAVDRAGNVQTEPSWGVLDDRPGAPFLVTEFLAPHVNATGFMDYRGDEDWWGVQAPGGRIQLQLVGLTFDADLEVYDEAGTLLGSSTNSGQRSEKIDLTVPAGRYELRIYSRAGEFSADHPYRVNVTALG